MINFRKRDASRPIILFLCMFFGLHFAGFQAQAQVNLSLNLQNVPLEQVLSAIETKTSYRFLYNKEIVDVTRKVSVNVQNKELSVVLSQLFADTDITYTLKNKQIVLSRASAQQATKTLKTIAGKVTDSSGDPLPGVSVILKGTTFGTTTDVDGKYTLKEVPENAILQFSFVGMKTQEIAVGTKSSINVQLAEEAIGLEEVVAVGYGIQKKRDLTGSVSSVSEKEFNSGVILSPEQLIQGKLSGVQIIQNDGQPGSNSTVRVRGGTSITAGNDPLYVIDGVPMAFSTEDFTAEPTDRMNVRSENPLNMLNPSDIESIDVLKDASATAIYGSRGANGVIMITTKKGKEGISSIDYESYVGISAVRRKLPVASASQYRDFLNANSSIIGNYDDKGANTNWQDKIFRTALTNSHSFALNGGNSKTNYRASFSYINQNGIIISSGMEKLTARFNINHKAFNDKLNININFTNGFTNIDNVPVAAAATGDEIGDVIRDALRYNPTYPIKDENGNYSFYSIFVVNPVAEAEQVQDEEHNYRALGNITTNLEITKFLKLNTNIGFTRENIERKYYAPKASKIAEMYGGIASQQSGINTSKLFESNLTFTRDFDRIHHIVALAGYSWQDFIYEGTYMRSQNFISDATSFNNLDGGLSYDPPRTSKSSNRLISFYGRLNYTMNEKYLVTFTLREDGSTRFGSNNRWGTFPSAALGWRISEESFLKDNPIISNLKFRLGYGVTGNQEIGNYKYLPTLSAGEDKYIFGGKVVTAVGPNQYYNPDLQWESTEQKNVGLDYGFLDGKINGSIDYYIKNTNHLLLSFQVPSPAEINTILANVGSVQNKGCEFNINAALLTRNKFKWDAYANLSINRNKVVSLSNDLYSTKELNTGIIPVPGFTSEHPTIIRPGEPLGAFYGYEYIGVNAEGVQQFKDINGDGKITPGDDKVIIGNSQPDFTYGFGTTLSFDKLKLDLYFSGVQGVDVFNATALDIQSISTLPGQNTLTAAFTDGIAYGQPAIYSSKWIQDASFLRLSTVALGYDFNVSSIPWIHKANIYLNAQNLFVITGYKGFDPEVNSIDFSTYPRPRTITLGLKFQF